MSDTQGLVLVTGAGGGIGAGAARRFGKEGYSVAVTDLDENAVRRVAEQVVAEGGEAHAWAHDVTDQDCIEATLGAAVETFGPLSG